jgi:excisionase family DNA binding protein
MKTRKVLSAQRAAARKKIRERTKKLAEAERRTISVEQAARALGVSRNSGYQFARDGVIPVLRLGNRLLVLKAPFEKMLQGAGAQDV